MDKDQTRDPLWSAAVVKLSMMKRGLGDTPGFRVVYMGTLTDLGVTDDAVNAYISRHRPALEAYINGAKPSSPGSGRP